MKTSNLLSTTVLVSAAALIAAAPASAAKLKLGGYYEQWFGWGADGTAAPLSNFDVKNDEQKRNNVKAEIKLNETGANCRLSALVHLKFFSVRQSRPNKPAHQQVNCQKNTTNGDKQGDETSY